MQSCAVYTSDMMFFSPSLILQTKSLKAKQYVTMGQSRSAKQNSLEEKEPKYNEGQPEKELLFKFPVKSDKVRQNAVNESVQFFLNC